MRQGQNTLTRLLKKQKRPDTPSQKSLSGQFGLVLCTPAGPGYKDRGGSSFFLFGREVFVKLWKKNALWINPQVLGYKRGGFFIELGAFDAIGGRSHLTLLGLFGLDF